MNVDLFAQKDWWWTPTGGLIKRKNSKPLSCRSYRRVLLKEKSLVLVYYRYKYQKKSDKEQKVVITTKTKTIHTIDGNVTLQMLSAALFTFIPQDSEKVLESMRIGCEDEHSVVVFLGFSA